MTIRDLKDIPYKTVELKIQQPDWTKEEADYYMEKQLQEAKKMGYKEPQFRDPLQDFTDFISAPIKFIGKIFK